MEVTKRKKKKKNFYQLKSNQIKTVCLCAAQKEKRQANKLRFLSELAEVELEKFQTHRRLE